MFLRRVRVEARREDGETAPCPIAWIDSFAMRNFTNSAVFDDTLPVEDGRMEIGARVPVGALRTAMEDWFRRKGYLKPGDALQLEEESPAPRPTASWAPR